MSRKKNKFDLKKIDITQIKDNTVKFFDNSKEKTLLWFGNLLGTGENTKKTWHLLHMLRLISNF